MPVVPAMVNVLCAALRALWRAAPFFAMGFSVFFEMLNLRVRDYQPVPVHLHKVYVDRPAASRWPLEEEQ